MTNAKETVGVNEKKKIFFFFLRHSPFRSFFLLLSEADSKLFWRRDERKKIRRQLYESAGFMLINKSGCDESCEPFTSSFIHTSSMK